jgi:hypothetical protein
MTSARALRAVLAACILGGAVAFGLSAAETDWFSASGVGAGTVLIWLTRSAASVEVSANVSLVGSFADGDGTMSFSAAGTASGSAVVDTGSLATTAWVVVAAVGEAANGDAVRLQGGFLISEITGDLTGTSGAGGGRFDLAILLPGRSLRASGTLQGTASGQFIHSDVPYAMKAAGRASLELDGLIERAALANEDPACRTDVLDLASWPEELAELLADWLGTNR